MHSIRRYMTMLIVSALVLIIFTAAIHGYRAAMAISSDLLDKELQSVLNILTLENVPSEATQHDSNIVYQFWQGDTLTHASQNVPSTPIAPKAEGLSDRNFNGQRWRVSVRHLVSKNIWLMVAQPVQNRYVLAESMTVSAITPFIISVPILAIIVFLSVSRGLAPLKRLSEKLSRRKGKDLSTIKLNDVPQELEPVLATLNSIFARLHDAFEREQQFAANAAHELRTPLSVMKINLHNLTKTLPDGAQQLASLQQDTNRMIHAVNQILLLSRTSPEIFEAQKSAVNLEEVAQQVITDMYGQIESREQDISLDSEPLQLKSTEFTLYTLLQNLIANASTYALQHAQIVVRIKQHTRGIILSVDDSGPGIEPAQRQQVLQRFYRTAREGRADQQGSGLGLAIVGQIVRLHNAKLTLEESELGGLSVQIVFPESYDL